MSDIAPPFLAGLALLLGVPLFFAAAALLEGAEVDPLNAGSGSAGKL